MDVNSFPLAEGVARSLQLLGWKVEATSDIVPCFRAIEPDSGRVTLVALKRCVTAAARSLGFPHRQDPSVPHRFLFIAAASDEAWIGLDASVDPAGPVVQARYSPCCFGSQGTYEVRAAGNFPEVRWLDAGCHHVHSSRADVEGYPTAMEAFVIAQAITSEGKPSGVRVSPEVVGQRLGVHNFEEATMGWRALDSLAFRHAGLPIIDGGIAERLPVDQLNHWLAARGSLTPRTGVVSQVLSWKDHHLYVGWACPRLQLQGSQWGNPFKTRGRGGSLEPEEAVRRYEAWLRSDPSRLARLAELSGRTLLCHCRSDAPCHRDVLVKLFNEVIRAPIEATLVYAGRSHLRQRYRRTKWCSAYQAGLGGSAELAVIRYAQSLPAELRDEAPVALRGRTVMCECPLSQPCHVDYLHSLLIGSLAPSSPVAYVGGSWCSQT